MADKTNVPVPLFQDLIRSKTVRTALQELQETQNTIIDEINVAIASTASEVTNARDGLSTLQENINIRRVSNTGVSTGGIVTAQTTPDETVLLSAGSCINPNGYGIEWSAQTSASIGTATNRWDVATINQSGILSIISGSDTAADVLPSLANTFQPIAILHITDTTGPTIANTDIYDARYQGARTNNKWFWSIQDAVNDLSSTLGGVVDINPGHYFEEVDLTGKNNIELNYKKGAFHYKGSDNISCIRSSNSSGTETNNIKITGGYFKGQGKGVEPIIKLNYTDSFILDSVTSDGDLIGANNMEITNCDNFILSQNLWFNSSGTLDYNTTTIDGTSASYKEDGFNKNQIAFIGDDGQKNEMENTGWVRLTALDGRYIKSADTGGGTQNSAVTHNHQWYSDTGTVNNDQSYDSAGSVKNIASDAQSGAEPGKAIQIITKDPGPYLNTDYYTDNDNTSEPASYIVVSYIHR